MLDVSSISYFDEGVMLTGHCIPLELHSLRRHLATWDEKVEEV